MHKSDTSADFQRVYDAKIKNLSGSDRFLRGISLTHWSRQLCLAGIRDRYPKIGEQEIRRLFLEQVYGITLDSKA